MMIGRRRGLTLAAGALMVVLPGCGGGGGSTPTTPATPAPPAQARITVTASAPVVTFSPRAAFTYRITVPATITESAGLGANINYVRLREIYLGVEIERSEISSADLIVATGTNRLGANATRTINLIFDVNDDRATSGILTFNFTDDRGNNLSVDFTITY
jgi:hypothetical protein